MEHHELIEKARQALTWTSFDPEKAATRMVDCFTQSMQATLQELDKLATNDAKSLIIEKEKAEFKCSYLNKFLEYINSQSRCASAAVAGPANFNLVRANKRNEAAHNKLGEYLDFPDHAIAHADKQLKKVRTIDERKHDILHHEEPIVRGEKGEVELLKYKLDYFEQQHARHIAENKRIRKEKTGEPLFYMVGETQKIRELKKRIPEAEKRQTFKTKSFTFDNGVKVEQNIEENRLKVLFDGKPSCEMIRLLKSKGMRWAPSKGAWQRQLTGNAQAAINSILSHLKEYSNA